MGLAFYSDFVKPQQIGEVIRAAREGRSMSQPTLAYLSGTQPSAISEIELGKRMPRWDTAARIAAVLNIPWSEISSAIEYEMAAAREPKPESPKVAQAAKEQRERMRKRHLGR